MKRLTYRQLIESIREHKRNCRIADQTFGFVPSEFKEAVRDDQQKRFDLWWDSWIEPKLAELEERLSKRKAHKL